MSEDRGTTTTLQLADVSLCDAHGVLDDGLAVEMGRRRLCSDSCRHVPLHARSVDLVNAELLHMVQREAYHPLPTEDTDQ